MREICADGVRYTMMGIQKIIFILPICSFPLVNTYIHVKFKVQCDFLSHSKVFFYDFLFSLFFNVIKKMKIKWNETLSYQNLFLFFYSHSVCLLLSPSFNFPFIMALKHTYMLRYLCLCIATSLYSSFLSSSFFTSSSSYYSHPKFLFLAHFS